MRILPVLTLSMLPVAVAAHPHVFVEAQVEIVVEDGAVVGVRQSWLYDDFFSFTLTADLGVDLDGDLVLTEEEAEVLSAAVLDWPPDYTGDLTVLGVNGTVELAPREDASMSFEDGRVREAHYRPLAQPEPAGAPVTVQVYDPYFYVAYEIVGEPSVDGTGCTARLVKADLDSAYAMVESLIGRPAGDVGQFEEFPMVGDAFADSVVVTCGG